MNTYRITNEREQNRNKRVVQNKKSNKKRTAAFIKKFSFLVFAFVLFASVICLINYNAVSASSSSERQIYYKSVFVEQGDSLWSIAEENMSEEWDSVKTYVQAIKKLNNKTDNQINAGAYISIPYYQ